MSRLTVLITAAGSTTAISVMKALRAQSEFEVRIVGTDLGNKYETAGSLFTDEFCQVPASESAEFVQSLLHICDQYDVKAIFPIVDSEIERMTASRDLFAEHGVTIFAPAHSVVVTCNDKLAAHEMFVAANIPTPRSWSAETIADQDPTYPLIIKPATGVSSRGLHVAEDHGELVSALRKTARPIIQELAPGIEYTIDVILDNNSQVISIVPRERIETKAGICTKGRTVQDSQLVEFARNVITEVGLTGPSNIQVIRSGNDIKLIEINPRFAATMTLSLAAGVNGPLLLLKSLLGMPIAESECVAEPDVFVARYWEEAIYRQQSSLSKA